MPHLVLWKMIKLYLDDLTLILHLIIILAMCSCKVLATTQGNEKCVEPKELTCWTCPNRTDNEACNAWAPDVPCPPGRSMCLTIHVFEPTKTRSIRVRKMCVEPTYCSSESVGCTDVNLLTRECRSCCGVSYCNEAVPFNSTTAIVSSVPSKRCSVASHTTLSISVQTLCLLFIFLCQCWTNR